MVLTTLMSPNFAIFVREPPLLSRRKETRRSNGSSVCTVRGGCMRNVVKVLHGRGICVHAVIPFFVTRISVRSCCLNRWTQKHELTSKCHQSTLQCTCLLILMANFIACWNDLVAEVDSFQSGEILSTFSHLTLSNLQLLQECSLFLMVLHGETAEQKCI